MMVLHHIYHKGAQCRPRQRLLHRQRRKEDYLAARRRKRKIIISAMRTLFTENTRRRMEGRGRSGHCGTVNGVKTKKSMYSGFPFPPLTLCKPRRSFLLFSPSAIFFWKWKGPSAVPNSIRIKAITFSFARGKTLMARVRLTRDEALFTFELGVKTFRMRGKWKKEKERRRRR